MNTLDFNQQTQTAETQKQLSPSDAIKLLKDGNTRFTNNTTLSRNHIEQVKNTSTGQYPFAAVVSCIDSRIPTEIIFNQGIGDIFNVRIAGNFVNTDILGSLEFACKLAGCKAIVILGHTSCGAIKGACDNVQLENLTKMIKNIKPAVDNVNTSPNEERTSANIDFVNRVAEENVKLTIKQIKENSSVLNSMMESGEINTVGAMYDVKTGIVIFM